MSFTCYFVNIFLQLLFFFTYHIFLYVYILLFGKGLFEGTGMGNNAIFTYFLYTCNGICSIKIPIFVFGRTFQALGKNKRCVRHAGCIS